MSTLLTLDRARALLTPPPPAPIVYAIEDVEHILGVQYTEEQRQALDVIPFSEEALRACAGTHLLFPGFPLSLLGLRERRPGVFFTPAGGWYAEPEQHFSRREVPLQWHLLRTGPLPDSFGKSADAQVRLLPEGESIPGVAEVALAAALHKLATGQHLLGTAWYRTADQTAEGYWVSVDWSGGRLYVNGWVGNASGSVGAVSARTS